MYKVRYQKSLSYSNLDKKFKFTESDKVIVENGYASFKFAKGFLIAGLIITLGAVCLIKFTDAPKLSFLVGLFIQVISVLQYLEWIGYLLYPAIAGICSPGEKQKVCMFYNHVLKVIKPLSLRGFLFDIKIHFC